MKRKYYIGRIACGCVMAIMHDDAQTTAGDVADFARDMARSRRKLEHVEWTAEELDAQFRFAKCTHRQSPSRQMSFRWVA
jgi:hypothetical protein